MLGNLATEEGESFDRLLYPFAVPGVNATWTVIVDIPHAAISAPVQAQTTMMIIGGVVMLAAVMLALFLAVRALAQRPLHGLVSDVERMSKGDYAGDVSNQDRQDEIGNLSIALRGMTNALYDRIDAIEQFAADVSHELKNPLTSLRSAVETLPLAKTDTSKQRLMDIIQHDVRRLDRLISDISDASRLDAELARVDQKEVDLEKLLGDLVTISREIRSAKKPVTIDLQIDRNAKGAKNGFRVPGHDLRLGQIITNLIENARSFVPLEKGRILVKLTRSRHQCVVIVEDNGPGIQAEDIERIFERFYTDRPEGEDFGQNSGLGLSISRQIAEAHQGTLRAENIAGDGRPGGARFILTLPAFDDA